MNFFSTKTLFLLALLTPLSLNAQDPVSSTPVLVVQVNGLTSAERDAIQVAGAGTNGGELVYACVPAGILVFRSTIGAQRTALKADVMPMLTQRLGAGRVNDTTMDQPQAEALCATKRGQ